MSVACVGSSFRLTWLMAATVPAAASSLRARQIRFYECKGYQPGGRIPDDEVDRWLVKRIPPVYKEVRASPDWKGRKFHFEFWTTGRLSDASIAKIEKAQAAVRLGRYTLDYYDSESLTAIAKATKDKALIDALRQHFLDHPMAKIQRTGTKRLRSESATAQGANQPIY